MDFPPHILAKLITLVAAKFRSHIKPPAILVEGGSEELLHYRVFLSVKSVSKILAVEVQLGHGFNPIPGGKAAILVYVVIASFLGRPVFTGLFEPLVLV